MNITNRGNDYQRAFGKLYDQTPKAVFAAVAFSLAHIDAQESSFADAVIGVLEEWRILHENGIVPQKPPAFKLNTETV